MQRMKPCDPKHPSFHEKDGLAFGEGSRFTHQIRWESGLTIESNYNLYHNSEGVFEVCRELPWATIASLPMQKAVRMHAKGELIPWIESEIAIDMLKESSR